MKEGSSLAAGVCYPMDMRVLSSILFVGLASAAMGCVTPAPPFNSMAQSQVTAMVLQNNQGQAGAAVPAANAGLLTMLPPGLQTMMSQSLGGLGSLLPPGLLPAGILPSTAAPAATAIFEGYPILKQNPVMDQGARNDLATLLGDPSSYESAPPTCMYPEFGVSFSPAPGAPANDTLISISCRNVQAANYAWPFANHTLKVSAAQKVVSIMSKILQ